MHSLRYLNALDAILEEPEYESLVRRAHLLRPASAVNRSDMQLAGEACLEEAVPKRFGTYELIETIGQGGMGRVYRARQLNANREVALKIIRPDFRPGSFSDSDHFVSRFRLEAQAMANVSHDHIVPVFEVGEYESRLFYSMRLIDGESLSQKLESGPLAPKSAAKIIRDCAAAVHEAHSAGILHRDIKPGNIMLDGGDRPFITDFGLAKRSDGTADGPTETGAFVGTASFISPEQAKDASRVDALSDIYSLGAVLYATLTGRPPFQAATQFETIRQVASEDVVSARKINPAIPRDLDTVCLKCLDKQPERRYRSAADLSDDLDRFLLGKPIRAVRSGVVRRTTKWVRRKPAFSVLMLLVASLIPISALWVKMNRSNTKKEAVAALCRAVVTARMSDLPELIREINQHEDVEIEYTQYGHSLDERLRAALTLLNSEPQEKRFELASMLGSLDSQQVLAVLGVLGNSGIEFDSEYWIAHHRGSNPLPIASLLAKFQPTHRYCERLAPSVSSYLLREDLMEMSRWVELLRPLSHELNEVLWKKLESSGNSDESGLCSLILAELYRHDTDHLARVLAVSQLSGLRHVLDRLGLNKTKALQSLKRLDAHTLSFERFGEVDVVLLERNLAIAQIELSGANSAWRELVYDDSSRLHPVLVSALAKTGVSAGRLIEKIDLTTDPDLLFGVLLALGEYRDGQFTEVEKKLALNRTRHVFRMHADGGVHSAAELLLRRLGDVPVSADNNSKNGWYTTRDEQTLVVFRRPGKVHLSRPPVGALEPTAKETVVELLPFSISIKEVTLAEYERFAQPKSHDSSVGPKKDCPVNGITFEDAARYCNWLTKRSGLGESDCCYRLLPAHRIEVKDDFCSRRGFRLPTEAEWEYACGKHSLAKHSEREFADSYAWHIENSDFVTWEVGMLRPTRFGLFDIYGNVYEWCHRVTLSNRPNTQYLKGGAFMVPRSRFSVERYVEAVPTWSNSSYGFRIAATWFDDRHF